MGQAEDVTTHQIQVEGSSICFVTCGDKSKPPLFLLHSFYLSGTIYDPFLPALGEKFFLVIPDFPGFGKSERLKGTNNCENYACVLETIRGFLGLGTISLFGFSAGGTVALKYAALFPKNVYRLSVQGAPYYYKDYQVILRDRILYRLTSLFSAFPKLLQLLSRYPLAWKIVRFFYRKLDRTIQDLGDERIKVAIESLTPSAAYEWGEDILRIDLRSDLKRITCPVQIIAGKIDPYLSLSSVYRMAAILKDAEVEVVRKGDHELSINSREGVADRLIDFLTYDF